MVFSFDNNEVQTKNNKPFLITVIVLLVALVIGLGVAIAVVVANNNNSGVEEEETAETITEAMNNIANRVNEVENWKDYIDGKISEYEGTEQEVEVRLIKVRRLLVAEGPISAIEEMEKMNVEEMNNFDKMGYYATMRDIKLDEKNKDEAEKYDQMREEIWEEYYNNGDGYGSD